MEVSQASKKRLEECERVLSEHVEEFVRVGQALREIRDERLYRVAGFESFDTYCKDRWDMGRTHAQRLMDASEIMKEIPQEAAPTWGRNSALWTERAVRPLSRLPTTNKIRAVAKKVVEHVKKTGKRLTSGVVETAVREELGEKKPKRQPAETKVPLPLVIRRWTGQIEGMADLLDRLSEDAIEIAAGDDPLVFKDFSNAIGRISSRMEAIRRPRTRRS